MGVRSDSVLLNAVHGLFNQQFTWREEMEYVFRGYRLVCTQLYTLMVSEAVVFGEPFCLGAIGQFFFTAW